MRFAAVRFVVLLLTVSVTSARSAETPDARSNVDTNAAMKYWEGFALLPTLDFDQERMLEAWNKTPIDVEAQALLQRSELSRRYLHRGARLSRCDWSLDYDDGIRLVLPHVPKSLTLSRLTALHARREFELGHWQAGWDDVCDLLILSHHIQATPIMISTLVGYKVESMAIEAASPWLPDLKGALAPNAFDLLDTLPERVTLVQLLSTETQMGPVWMLREMKKAEDAQTGGWQAVWNEVLSLNSEEPDSSLHKFAQSVKTYEQARKKLEDHIAMSQKLEKIAALPWKEFDSRYAEFLNQLKSDPNAGFLLPNLDKFVPSQRRATTQMALFKAARSIVVGGPDKVKETVDPFGNGPFEYRAQGKGFELKSAFVFKDHPMSLAVGRPANRR
jgi:hypothetical protein